MATHADFYIPGNTITLQPTVSETAGQYIFNVKEFLKSAGWLVLASSDGTNLSLTSDIITDHTLMNQDFAWVRLVSPDLANEYILQLVVAGSGSRCRVVWNGGNGTTFTNGGTATQHPDLSIGSEIILVGVGGTAAAPSTATTALWWGDSGSNEPGTLALGVAETVAPYRFWTTSNRAGTSNNRKVANFLLDQVDSSPQGDSNYVSFCSTGLTDGWQETMFESATSGSGQAWTLSGGLPRRMVLTEPTNRSAQIPADPNGASFMGTVFWIQGDNQVDPIGLYGASTMLHKMIQVSGAFPDQNTQINTEYGPLSHIFADDYALPWPAANEFTHFSNPWNVITKRLFEVSLIAPPDAPPVSGSGETTAPLIQNLLPADMSSLNRDDYITFSAVDIDSEINKVLVWAKFEGDAHTELMFDGDSFIGAFTEDSTVIETPSSHTFSIRPKGGWTQNIASFTVRVVDIWGNFDGEDGGPGGGVGE